MRRRVRLTRCPLT
uniref:Uncharacterized protein n=1 Tax=Arundo donax TaxID=35708 RepID=A0A0A9EAC2_ARUDO